MARRPVEGSGSAAYQRMAQREEEARAAMNDRIEAALDHIVSELGDIRTDVRRLEQGSHTLTNRIADVERQIIDTRDEVQKRALNPAPSQIASAKTAIKDTLKSKPGLIAASVTVITFGSILANQLPDGVRFLERLWNFLAGRDVKAVEVVIPPDSAKVPEK